MKPTLHSLATHLDEHYRIKKLFAESNLFEAIKKNVLNRSLYLPQNGYNVISVSFRELIMTWSRGYHRIEMSVSMEGYNEDRDENDHTSNTLYIDIPITLIDGYTIKTEKYGHPSNNLTREVMTFVYPKKAFNQWAANRRNAIMAERFKELVNKRDKLNKEIKRLV